MDAFNKPVGLLTRDSLIEALRASGEAAITQALKDAGPRIRRRDKLDLGVREINRLNAPQSASSTRTARSSACCRRERGGDAHDPQHPAGMALPLGGQLNRSGSSRVTASVNLWRRMRFC